MILTCHDEVTHDNDSHYEFYIIYNFCHVDLSYVLWDMEGQAHQFSDMSMSISQVSLHGHHDHNIL